MIVSALSLTACNKNDKNENEGEGTGEVGNQTTDKTYTVTIVDGDKNPVEGVKLVITDGSAFPTATTGADGKASVSLPEGTISVMVTTVPSGYEKPEKVSGGVYHGVFKAGSYELTITIEKEVSNTVAYTVRVVDQNGDAVEGIDVQLCYDNKCIPQYPTDANGELVKELAPGYTVDVKLYELEGYTLPEANDHGYHAVIEAGETEITVVITKN